MSLNPDDSLPIPKERSIAFPTDNRHRVNLLPGPPETRFLKSGFVKLSPGESIGGLFSRGTSPSLSLEHSHSDVHRCQRGMVGLYHPAYQANAGTELPKPVCLANDPAGPPHLCHRGLHRGIDLARTHPDRVRSAREEALGCPVDLVGFLCAHTRHVFSR